MTNIIKIPQAIQGFSGKTLCNCDIMNPTYEEHMNNNVEKLPKFSRYNPHNESQDFKKSLSELTNTLIKMTEHAYAKFVASARGQDILAKAHEYNIPYNKDNIDWFGLINEIDEYELLLEEAAEKHIDWDLSEYDLVGLKQEIEYHERQATEANRELYNSYYSNANLGV